jgi:hypothetical protein
MTGDLFADLPPVGRPAVMRSAARQRKERGQLAALQSAGPDWLALVLARLPAFLVKVNGADFTFEQFRNHCEAEKVPAPKSVNAWGSVPKVARKAGLVVFTGEVRNTTRPASHARLIKVWRAA